MSASAAWHASNKRVGIQGDAASMRAIAAELVRHKSCKACLDPRPRNGAKTHGGMRCNGSRKTLANRTGRGRSISDGNTHHLAHIGEQWGDHHVKTATLARHWNGKTTALFQNWLCWYCFDLHRGGTSILVPPTKPTNWAPSMPQTTASARSCLRSASSPDSESG